MRRFLFAAVIGFACAGAQAADLRGGAVSHAQDYATIAAQAEALKAQTQSMAARVKDAPIAVPADGDYALAIARLADEAAKTSVELKADGDPDELACILGGVSKDLHARLSTLSRAKTPAEQDLALREMTRLLDDSTAVLP